MNAQRWTLDSLPDWIRRIDPVAWFPVAAMLVTAALAVVTGNPWWAFLFVLGAAAIVVLEAAVFGPAWRRATASDQGAVAEQPTGPVRPAAVRVPPRRVPPPRAAAPPIPVQRRPASRADASPSYR